MKNDKGLVLDGLHRFRQFGVERIEIGEQLLGIGLIGCGIAGIGRDQRGFYCLDNGLGIGRVQSGVGVIGAVVAVIILGVVMPMIVRAFLFGVAVMRPTAFFAIVMRLKRAAFAKR